MRRSPKRRAFLATTASAGLACLAGCDGASNTPDDSGATTPGTADESEATARRTADGAEGTPTATGPAIVSGQLVDASGEAVTTGEAISLGNPEGLVSVAPDSTGAFELEVTAGQTYSLQYTQGVDDYPDDDLPDLYTIDEISPRSDVDLGTIRLPMARDVEVTVETGSGDDVTDEAQVFVTHERDGATSGFELIHDPIELTGHVSFEASYDGRSTTREVDISEPRSVTMTVE